MAAKLPMPFGAYALLKSLGQGAMGDIHLARPYNPRRGVPTPIVIKRLHGELASNPDFVRRFKHEAEIAVSVDSPHVAKVYDVGAVGETLYIAMEYVNGWPVSKFIEAVIASGHHANISAIIDLIAGGLVGLDALHTAKDVRTGKPLGVVHRDISPKNLMVGEDGQMRLIDLGLGKSNVQDWKTRTGVVMGSVGYMPPEQVTAEGIDHRADLYAMGAVLFELLALRHYIPRGMIPVMLRASVNPTFEPPSKYRPDVPRGLDDVLKKALALDPADRYQSATDFLAAIRGVVPERRTAGGMASLIGDLFATSLPERKSELSMLLRAPLPELEEGPEPEHTVTFVVAEGVAELSPDDMPRTRLATAAGVTVGPASARVGPRVEIVASPGQLPLPPQGYAPQMQELGAPMPDGGVYTGIPSASLPATHPAAAVPTWVLAVAVVAALAIGAIASIALRGGDDAPVSREHEGLAGGPTAPPTFGVVPGVVAAPPSATPGAVGATSSAVGATAAAVGATPSAVGATPAAVGATAAGSLAPGASDAPSPSASGPPTPEPPATAPAPTAPRRSALPAATPSPPTTPAVRSEPPVVSMAPNAEVSRESVRALADKLMTRATRLLESTTDAEKQKSLTKILTGVTMEAASTSPERALPRLRAYEQALDALER